MRRCELMASISTFLFFHLNAVVNIYTPDQQFRLMLSTSFLFGPGVEQIYISRHRGLFFPHSRRFQTVPQIFQHHFNFPSGKRRKKRQRRASWEHFHLVFISCHNWQVTPFSDFFIMLLVTRTVFFFSLAHGLFTQVLSHRLRLDFNGLNIKMDSAILFCISDLFANMHQFKMLRSAIT